MIQRDRFEAAIALPALATAAHRAARGKRDRPEVAAFLMDLEPACLRLQRALRSDAWRPSPLRTFRICDPKPRTISVVPFADRVVHHALCAAVVPAFERYAISDSFACRPGRGQHRALHRARRFAAAAPYALKGDIAAFFASIPHDRLLPLCERLVAHPRLFATLARVIAAGAVTPGRGLPIGSLTSQHLANLYLGRLDHFVKDQLGVRRYLRYMDDFLLFDEPAAVRALLPEIRDFLAASLGLSLSPRATRVLPVHKGVPFLGFRVFPRLIRISQAAWRRLRRGLRRTQRLLEAGRIDDGEAAASAASRCAHLRHFATHRLRQSTFSQGPPGSGAGPAAARSGSTVAAPSTTRRGTCGSRSGTTIRPAIATTTWAFALRARQ